MAVLAKRRSVVSCPRDRRPESRQAAHGLAFGVDGLRPPLGPAKLQRAKPLNSRTRIATPEEINADMFAFWNGNGGHTWVARQGHTDITLTPVTDALLGFAAPRPGERVVDIGCGCGP